MTVTVAPASETARPPSRLVSTWAPLVSSPWCRCSCCSAEATRLAIRTRSGTSAPVTTSWQTWQFAGPDPWSPFTANTWVLHEWVPELALSLANRVDGLTGVAWAWYVGTVLVALAFYASCRSQGRIVLSAIATVLALLGAAASLTPRPQLVSIALAAVVTAAWLSSARDGRARWWLVPMTWVWACSHGMWFVSPLVGGAVVLGLLLNRDETKPLRRLADSSHSRAHSSRPSHPRDRPLLLAPLSVSGYTRFVSEWDPPRLSSPPVAVTLLLLAVVAAIWVRSGRRVSWASLLVWVVALGWALAYTRTVAVAAAIAAPLVVAVVSAPCPRRQPRVVHRPSDGGGSNGSPWSSPWSSAECWPLSSCPPPPRPPTGCRPDSTPLSTGFPPAPWSSTSTGSAATSGTGTRILCRHRRADGAVHGRLRRGVPGRSRCQARLDRLLRADRSQAALVPASPRSPMLSTGLGWRSLGDSRDYVLIVSPRTR